MNVMNTSEERQLRYWTAMTLSANQMIQLGDFPVVIRFGTVQHFDMCKLIGFREWALWSVGARLYMADATNIVGGMSILRSLNDLRRVFGFKEVE